MSCNRFVFATILLALSGNTSAFHHNGQQGRSVSALNCKSGSLNPGSTFSSPESVSQMMRDVAEAIVAARDAQVSLALVDVPIPVTGKLLIGSSLMRCIPQNNICVARAAQNLVNRQITRRKYFNQSFHYNPKYQVELNLMTGLEE